MWQDPPTPPQMVARTSTPFLKGLGALPRVLPRLVSTEELIQWQVALWYLVLYTSVDN